MARTVGLLLAFAALALAQDPSDPCANPVNICCNPTVRTPLFDSLAVGVGEGT